MGGLSEIEVSFKRMETEMDPVDGPESIYNLLMDNCFEYGTIQLREEMCMVALDVELRPLGWKRVSTGSVKGTVTNISLIAGIAIKSNASNVIVAHNHPSGSLIPSPKDVEFVENLRKGLGFFEIKLLDSMIVSHKGYFSFVKGKLLKY